jgi:hypothetical protein
MRVPGRQVLRWRRFSKFACASCLAVASLFCQLAHAADAPVSEYQVKTAYLYNFITFTEWPAGTGVELRLCIYGPDPFGDNIDALQGKAVVDGRTLAVARITTVELLDSCQIVFLSREVISNLPRILDQLRGKATLIVADSPGAMREGVGINMLNDGDKVSFEVNLNAVHAQGLNLSFRLLRLAAEVVN